MTHGETWVSGSVQGKPDAPPVQVHASFLAPYNPLTLGGTVELSDVRLTSVSGVMGKRRFVKGCLRNISSQTLSQCVVNCVLQDVNARPVDSQLTAPLALPPYILMPFQAELGSNVFASISLQITHATPDGLRNYLPAVVIQRSSVQ